VAQFDLVEQDVTANLVVNGFVATVAEASNVLSDWRMNSAVMPLNR